MENAEVGREMEKGPDPQPELQKRSMNEADILRAFTYHPPGGNQAERYKDIRNAGWNMATLIDGLCPDSREKSLAITKLRETIMWANAAIACNE